MIKEAIEQKTECDLTIVCPIVLKCKVLDIYTRKDTQQCPCRDMKKEENQER